MDRYRVFSMLLPLMDVFDEHHGAYYINVNVKKQGTDLTFHVQFRYANNSNYKNDTMIRKEGFVGQEVLDELKRIIEDAEVLKSSTTHGNPRHPVLCASCGGCRMRAGHAPCQALWNACYAKHLWLGEDS